ncbi:MAG: hypothetical protein WC975_05815 [Phycisphaerae bacterium]
MATNKKDVFIFKERGRRFAKVGAQHAVPLQVKITHLWPNANFGERIFFNRQGAMTPR